MRFLVEFDVRPYDGRGPITAEQVALHLREYTFVTGVGHELTLLPGNGDHGARGREHYRQFEFINATVEVQP